jgi:hypothetical protein
LAAALKRKAGRKTAMDHSPTDDPDYLDRAIARVLLRAAEDPRDVRRLLEKLAAALELTAARVPVPEEGERFLRWRKENQE